jgi:hypothetical protein
MFSFGQTEKLVDEIVLPFITLISYSLGNLLQNHEVRDLISWLPLLNLWDLRQKPAKSQPIQSLYPLKVSQTGCTFTRLEGASQSRPRFHISSGPRVKMVMADNHSSTWANVIDWGWPMIVCGSA